MSAPSTHPVEPAEGDPSVPGDDGGADKPEGGEADDEGSTAGGPAPAEGAEAPLAAAPGEGGPMVIDEDGGGGGGGGGGSQAIDWALGVVRAGVGAALVVAPGWAGRIWVGPGADGPGSKVFARALGARDVALGVQIVRGLSRGEPVRHWVMAGFVADAADVTASIIAARHMTPARRLLVPLVAGTVGALGVASWRAVSPESPESAG